MAKKLYGTDPDQVPTNADLGTIAYQDKDNVHLTGRVVVSAVNPAPFTVPNASESLEINDGSTTKLLMYADNSNAYIQASKYDGTNPGRTLIFATKQGTDGIAAESARFNVSGNLAFPNGQGIDFSASQGGGASSSILDDYEEGTWTPNVSTGSLSVTGTYVKVGKLVSIFLNGQVTTGGATQISGLPFNTAGNYGFSPYVSTQDIPAGQNSITFVTNGTALLVRAIGDNTSFTDTALTTGAYIHASFVYEAA